MFENLTKQRAVERLVGVRKPFTFDVEVAVGEVEKLSVDLDPVADSFAASTFLAVPLTDMLVFALLVAAAIYYRQRPDTHKRLMLLATIGLLDAAISRWRLAFIQSNDVAYFVVTDVFVVAAVMYDLATRRRVDPANIWGGLLLIGSQPLRLLISHTSAWLSFASLVLR